ncbi:DUF6461 domain-containing protein [Herbidospora sp. RD11066]
MTDYSWFSSSHLAEAFSFIFVRGYTPEKLVTHLGGQVGDFTWMTFDESINDGDERYIAVTGIGDWALIALYNSWLAANDDFTVPLSAGTRVVSLYRLDIKDLEDFRWIEDGDIRFGHWAQEGYSEEVPAELTELMKEIGDDHDLYRGPGLRLIEHLTGVRLTPEIFDDARYLAGTLPS